MLDSRAVSCSGTLGSSLPCEKLALLAPRPVQDGSLILLSVSQVKYVAGIQGPTPQAGTPQEKTWPA